MLRSFLPNLMIVAGRFPFLVLSSIPLDFHLSLEGNNEEQLTISMLGSSQWEMLPAHSNSVPGRPPVFGTYGTDMLGNRLYKKT